MTPRPGEYLIILAIREIQERLVTQHASMIVQFIIGLVHAPVGRILDVGRLARAYPFLRLLLIQVHDKANQQAERKSAFTTSRDGRSYSPGEEESTDEEAQHP